MNEDISSLKESISLNVRQCEALVLFEFLRRFNELKYPPDDPIEQKVLYDLQAQIERSIFRSSKLPRVADVLVASRKLISQDLE